MYNIELFIIVENRIENEYGLLNCVNYRKHSVANNSHVVGFQVQARWQSP